MKKSKKLFGIITCPSCSHKQKMEIPINVCKAFYTCDKCKKTTFAKAGCCVFCDYGDKPCPVSHKK
ncbi:MAG: hypothetical protein HYS32_02820 [Candidatus Woesearchaeota archaeon]|nr:MAG: hypothetical protein HYS32_02820 [Candidatus Woesearchaeota archaeon]